MTETAASFRAARAAGQPLIDSDVHATVPGIGALIPYLSERGRQYAARLGFKGPGFESYPPGAPTSARPRSRPPDGRPPASDVSLVRAQVLDVAPVQMAILNCSYAVESIDDPELAEAIASATNDWLQAEWLDREPRLRASIVVPSQQPLAAAREIERVGGRPGFVQVYLPVRSQMLYGNREYHPLFEAAVDKDLVVALHFGGGVGNPSTPSGWPSYYLEEYVGMSQVFESQIMNLIAEGVFDRFPSLRIAIVEVGWAWVPAWMWRMDKEWKGLQREMPWVRRPPSDYIRKHMRFTLQPIDVPGPEAMLGIVEQMASDDLVMYSSDYPHSHGGFDAAELLARLPDGLAAKIRTENARAFYRLA